ncbi:MAG: hypothetical protein JOZ65_20495 [Chloroflexi bacterium]|nr:hypothetical protein [Chloroflexota bacterium]
MRSAVALVLLLSISRFAPTPTSGQLPALMSASQQLTLDGSSSKAQYSVGEPVQLGFTLTNTGDQACSISRLADGAITITDVSRDGASVASWPSTISYYDGLGSHLTHDVTQLSSGAQTLLTRDSFAMGPSGALALTSVAASDDESNDLTGWAVDAPGTYAVSAVYSFPPLSNAPQDVCQGPSNPVTITFSVMGDDQSAPAADTTNGDGSAASPSDGLLQLVSGTPEAQLQVSGSTAFRAQVTNCFAQFDKIGATDPDIFTMLGVIRTSPNVITIAEVLGQANIPMTTPDSKSDSSNGKGTGSTVNWNPEFLTTPQDGPIPDACDTLFHELYHAYDAAKGVLDRSRCSKDVRLPLAEVRATFAENKYRALIGAAPRTTYNGVALPTALSKCDQRGPTSRTGGTSRIAGLSDCNAQDPSTAQAAFGDATSKFSGVVPDDGIQIIGDCTYVEVSAVLAPKTLGSVTTAAEICNSVAAVAYTIPDLQTVAVYDKGTHEEFAIGEKGDTCMAEP